MARINKGALSRLEIIREASRQFLEKGYSSTTVTAIAKALEMSPGNLTFYFPTKEHLLAELVEALCSFQWKMMEEEANERIQLQRKSRQYAYFRQSLHGAGRRQLPL